MAAACLGAPLSTDQSPTTATRGAAEVIHALPPPPCPLEDTVAIATLPAASAPVVRTLVGPWEALAERLSLVTPGGKDGPACMPASIEPGPRTGERVQGVTAVRCWDAAAVATLGQEVTR